MSLKPDSELLKEAYLINLKQNTEFASFWTKGIDIDPYKGSRMWEEGVFINGRLEGAGKYCYLDEEGTLLVKEAMFRHGEIDEDGSGDNWKFMNTPKIRGETNTPSDKFVAPKIIRSLFSLKNVFKSVKLL